MKTEPVFIHDDALGYRRSVTPLQPAAPLRLDPGYRLAHLPLVNAHHPDVIIKTEGKLYDHGRHPRVFSLVLPVPQEAIETSPAFHALQKSFQKGPLAEILAWEVIPLRADKLHATLCSVQNDNAAFQSTVSKYRSVIRQTHPFEVELRGAFSGNINIGRLYLKLYPESLGTVNSLDAMNPIQQLQAELGQRQTDLYLVGLHNMKDHLTVPQTEWLMALIKRWWNKPILRFRVDTVWLLSSCDDLVLDARIEEKFKLKSS